MYIPPHFKAPGIDAMHELIEAHPLASLVTLNDGFPVADQIPMLLSRHGSAHGLLSGHLARHNPLRQQHPPETDVLAILQGPQAYISPNWYRAKAESHRVVPTWNYVSVQARGRIRFIEDPEWLLRHVAAATAHHERHERNPWQVGDAPADFIHRMVQSIVGFEIVITSLDGKWKVSQNRPGSDIEPLAEQLLQLGHSEMARLVRANRPEEPSS